MKYYEIVHHDGTISQMTLGDIPTTAEAEVAKWPDAQRLSVKEIRPVMEHAPAAPALLPSLAAIPSGELSADTKALMIEMAEALAAANRKIAALEATSASHDRTFEALKGAV